jgi:hypothetical protein
LEIFSLVWLHELEELPLIHEGAMPSLKIFTMMQCEALKMFPKSYLTIKKTQKNKSVWLFNGIGEFRESQNRE